MEILRPISAEVPIKPVLAFMLVGAMAHNAFAQISKVEPAEPRWSQTITVTYDPRAKGAKLNRTDEIFVVMSLFYEDHIKGSWGEAEIPELNRLVKDFKDKDVVFIAFVLDEAKDVQASLKELNFNYHIVSDSSAIAAKFDVSAYPKHVVIDKEGRIYAVLEGVSETRHDDLQRLIERALGS
jgi:peroxiredoxin